MAETAIGVLTVLGVTALVVIAGLFSGALTPDKPDGWVRAESAVTPEGPHALPPYGEHVLVYDRSAFPPRMGVWWRVRVEGKGDWWMSGTGYHGVVSGTWWRPLPEPPV